MVKVVAASWHYRESLGAQAAGGGRVLGVYTARGLHGGGPAGKEVMGI